jgi:hypothetical protein
MVLRHSAEEFGADGGACGEGSYGDRRQQREDRPPHPAWVGEAAVAATCCQAHSHAGPQGHQLTLPRSELPAQAPKVDEEVAALLLARVARPQV